MGKFLTKEQRAELRLQHRSEKLRRYADRIKALLALDDGYAAEEISEILLLDERTLLNYKRRYKEGGIEALCKDEIKGRSCRLCDEDLERLRKHLSEKLYGTTREIIEHVKEEYQVEYTESGMTNLLHRMGFVYKKTRLVPGKADAEAQEKFLLKLNELQSSKGEGDKLYYLDGVHPQHNSQAANGWILKGHDKELKTNTGRMRLNINGALDSDTHEVIYRGDDKINAESTIELLKMLEEKNPNASKIYAIADNARYYKNKKVSEYLKGSTIELIFLPAYAPNLNLIEKFWKFFKKQVCANKYYETFTEFKEACIDFFDDVNRLKFTSKLKTLLTKKFQIISAPAEILS